MQIHELARANVVGGPIPLFRLCLQSTLLTLYFCILLHSVSVCDDGVYEVLQNPTYIALPLHSMNVSAVYVLRVWDLETTGQVCDSVIFNCYGLHFWSPFCTTYLGGHVIHWAKLYYN